VHSKDVCFPFSLEQAIIINIDHSVHDDSNPHNDSPSSAIEQQVTTWVNITKWNDFQEAPMSLPNELELAIELIQRAKEQGIELLGPAETEYGFGWIPTVTIWHGERRVHFHYGFLATEAADNREDVLTLEVGFEDATKPVSRTPITTFDEAWDVVEKILIQGLTPQDINRQWLSDSRDCNKSIPHPPNTYDPANIVSLLSRGNWTPWHPHEK
jgi:hypothetical protein